MKAFEDFRGVIVPLDRANVDTDAIIPKQFLKSIARTGFGESLFFDWRYLPEGKNNPDFILNRKEYQKGTILITRNNFGCGSSREHAVWAVVQYGFHVVIAPWAGEGIHRTPAFADIFRSNCVKNGLLTIELAPADVDRILKGVLDRPGLEAAVCLADQTVTLLGVPEKPVFYFEMDRAVKERFLQGVDDIGMTLKEEAAIAAYEKNHDVQLPRS